jgi:ribulose-phosphate 3-epimerase
MKYVLSPSILAADFTKLGEQMKMVQENGAKYLHFDVMDGHFVPSISFGMPVLQSIRQAADVIYDVHLMIEEPIRYVEEFAKAGADIITVHLEACDDIQAVIDKIRACGCKVGISIKPNTPVAQVLPFVDKVDMVLIMTVEPGFGGQAFIESSLEKITHLRKELRVRNLEVDIQVDGGIYLENVRKVLDAGANVIVAGSAVFNGNLSENTEAFVGVLKEYEQRLT